MLLPVFAPEDLIKYLSWMGGVSIQFNIFFYVFTILRTIAVFRLIQHVDLIT